MPKMLSVGSAIELQENEIVKSCDVLDMPGLLVTNFGRVFRSRTIVNKYVVTTRYYEVQPYINKTRNNKSGYYRFQYCGRLRSVHNLVGKLFVHGYEQGKVLDHINEDSLDNHASNLQWITLSDNVSKSMVYNHKLGLYKDHLNKLHNKNKGDK